MATYGEMRDRLKEYSQRRNIPDTTFNLFMDTAQSRANRSLRIPSLEQISTQAVSTTGYFDVPADYLEMRSVMAINNDNLYPLERKSYDEINQRLVYTKEGAPCYFGRWGDATFRVAPYRAEGDQVYLTYYKILPDLVADSETNWFFTYSPELILYGGMEELSKYARDQEGTQRWGEQFQRETLIVQAMEDRSAWSGSTLAVSVGGR